MKHKSFKGKNVLIVCAGVINSGKYLKDIIKSADFIICVNGGFKNAKRLKIKPDLVIGDLDSLPRKTLLNRIKVKKYPKEKDYSDTELAISFAAKKGASMINIIGALGKRIDHTIANIISIGKFPAKACIIDDFSEITVHNKSFSLKGKKGDTVSLFPFFKDVSKISGSGFKYSLKNTKLTIGSLGLSNEMTHTKAHVKFNKGKILLVRTKRR